ncbi:MAG: hypothetical protein KAT32_04820 [Candidatus Moranbacteria bacterium]|nr:hypothetical protein [Candidatus Moranbacteria bacterium]
MQKTCHLRKAGNCPVAVKNTTTEVIQGEKLAQTGASLGDLITHVFSVVKF